MKNYSMTNALNHKVTFIENISKSELEDQNWEEKYITFADVRPMYDNKFGSIENFSFGHIVTEAFFIFKIRFTEAVHAKMRIMLGGRMFEIKRIINDKEASKVLKIIALEM